MIRVFSVEKKGDYSIIAVADHQRDLNNLRLMSYSLFEGKDKLQLNKDEFGGPYIKIPAEDFKNAEGIFDTKAMDNFVKELSSRYN